VLCTRHDVELAVPMRFVSEADTTTVAARQLFQAMVGASTQAFIVVLPRDVPPDDGSAGVIGQDAWKQARFLALEPV
jgi:hypothetical protein